MERFSVCISVPLKELIEENWREKKKKKEGKWREKLYLFAKLWLEMTKENLKDNSSKQ